MSSNIFGIDMGSHSIKVAVIEKSFRSHEIIRLARRKIAGMNEAEVFETLLKVLGQLGYGEDEDHIALIYPAGKLSSRTMDLPLTRRRQISETLPFEIEAQTPFDAEDFVCDFATIETSDSGTKVFAVMALKTDLEKFLETYKEAGLNPDFVIPSPLAVAAGCSQDVLEDGHSLIVDIGAGSTLLTMLKGRTPLSFYTVPEGAGDIYKGLGENESDLEQALEKKWPPTTDSDKWDGPIRKFSTSVALNLKRLIMAADLDEEESEKIKIIAVGAPGHSARLRNILAEETGYPVSPSTLSTSRIPIDDDMRSRRSAPSTVFAGAIGAALRVVDRERFDPVNLRVGRFEKKRKFTGDKNQAIVAIALLVVGLLIGFTSFVVEGVRLGKQYESIKQDIRAQFKKALPEVKRIVAETQQLKNAMNDLNEKSRTLGPALVDRDPFLDRLVDLSRAAPEDVRLDVDALVYEWGQITISGRTESFEKVEQLKTNIEKLPWAATVIVDKAKADPSASTISFRLEIKIIS